MQLVDEQHVVEQLAPYASDKPFRDAFIFGARTAVRITFAPTL